jgi:ubiquinone/menaquinone biosynthesis C-methylase UbiE
MRRQDWGAVAKGWESRADAFRGATMPVASWMIDHTAPQVGQIVLELAAGIGDTGFLAAELVQPGGTLITSDASPEMLSAAQRRAEALGITNVRFKQIDASQPIDIEAASIDVVLCRWGYMLMDDPENALQETRRVLRPGGRVALAAWAAAADNRWSSLPIDLLLERGLVEPIEPGAGGQFAWAEEGIIAERLENAGFVEYEVEALDFPIRYPSVDAWWATSRSMSMRAGRAQVDDPAELLAALADAAREWTADDGSIAVPARTWVAAATG